jgi:acetyl esterase/lipase
LPADVFIGGDSAGGNLALAVLSHLSHPHPDIDPLEVAKPLAGIAIIGPWIYLGSNSPSMRQDRYNDIVDVKSTALSGKMYLNGKKADNWSEPIVTTPDWWKGAKVKDALILAGSDEVLLSSIEEFETTFKVGYHSA